MQTLTFTRPNDLALLHDELIAGVPGFHRIIVTPDGDSADADCGPVEASGNTIRVTVADDVAADQVNSIVQTHDPANRTLNPAGQRNARIKELLAVGRSNWTAAQRNEIIELIGQKVT